MEDALKKKKEALEQKIVIQNEKKTIFSELSHIFKTVSAIVADTEAISSVAKPHTLLPRKKVKEMLDDAKKIIESIHLFKEKLTKEFGQASYVFITRSIDPIIEEAGKIIEQLYASLEKDSHDDMFTQAIRSAQFYLQFSDESHLRKRIISDGISTLRGAIEKDMHVLREYVRHSLQENNLYQDEIIARFDAALEPIFEEFQAMAFEKIATDNLLDFFVWKSKIDDRRAALTEEGFIIIDGLLAELKPEEAEKKPDLAAEPTEADWPS